MDSGMVITPFLFLSEEEAETRRAATPPEKELTSLSSFFKMFSDNTRLGILFYLGQGELCVGDLAALMDMTPSAVSHQLKLLKSTGLVRFRREGKILFYSLADEHVHAITNTGLEHIRE